MDSSFRFKQFSVADDKCTMKVGTDAVLLGCWVNPTSAQYILDIGTGSGVIALMMAQRSNALIDGIDIDPPSIEQARQNIANSKWGGRMNIINKSLQKYCKNHSNKYDLIVTNPPFFSNSLRSPKENRNISRHNDKLNFDELIFSVKKLLDQDGRFCLILPENESEVFKDKAIINGLFPLRNLNIYPKKERAVKRILSEYCLTRPSLEGTDRDLSVLMIRNDDNTFTEEYQELTKDFYLEF
ncbi:MAG: methyltransferase [Bacteroidales bacterium]|nr:methyltransferase [Bacteroidales bacterium]